LTSSKQVTGNVVTSWHIICEVVSLLQADQVRTTKHTLSLHYINKLAI